MTNPHKYKIIVTSMFRKNVKKIKKRGYKLSLLDEVVEILASGNPLPEKYKDHNLIGDFVGFRECHITADWLLIYRISDEELYLVLSRTGTHSDLF